MRGTKRFLALAAGLIVLSGSAQAYYFFVHYLNRTGPFTPVPEKFDLNALFNRTVPFLISEAGPTQLAPNDSFAGVVSQIRLAAKAWNDVESSQLRLAFGGFFTPGTPLNSPAIEVVFDDIPPGLIAQGGPTLRAELTTGPGGQFVPILRSTVILNRDLTQRPSFSEGFFLSVTHEFGHALGLQHTLTSGVMATEITRATTKGRPLALDDIVGVSLLYPAQNLPATTGTVAGRVTLSGAGVNLASVVALSPEGTAVSAITNPDGSYRIEGLPPGSYFVYVHPLPPAFSGESYPANIFPPVDMENRPFPTTTSFETVFYPGTKDANRATAVAVAAGTTLDGVHFSISRRNAPAVYAVQTFSFPGQVAVKPAHLSTAGGRSFIVANGVGLSPSAGISVIGGSAVIPPGGVKPYFDARFLQLDFQLSPFSGEGARHLTFAADNDLYVLPAAFRITRRLPPSVTSVAYGSIDGSGARQVTVHGTGLGADSQILFDGMPATIRQVDEAGSTILVVPPPAAPGHRSAVVALNSDGQSSLFLQGSAPAMFDHDTGDLGSYVMNPSQLPAGGEAMVEIIGTGTNFQQAWTTLAFGSAEVFVRRQWVVSPTRILANVVVSRAAASTSSAVTVANGLRTLTMSAGFQVTPANPRQAQFSGPVADAVTGRTDVQQGGAATVRLAGSVADLPSSAIQISVNDRPATIVSLSGGQLVFRVPAGLPPGPAILRMTANGEAAPPIVMSIDLPPPVLNSVAVSGTRVDAQRPARPGELLSVSVSGLGDNGTAVALSRVKVIVSGVQHSVVQITQANGTHIVMFLLDSTVPAGSHPLTVTVDGRESAPLTLPVVTN